MGNYKLVDMQKKKKKKKDWPSSPCPSPLCPHLTLSGSLDVIDSQRPSTLPFPGRSHNVSRPERICTHFSMLGLFHSSQNTSIGGKLVLITHRAPNYLNQLLRQKGAVVLSLSSFSVPMHAFLRRKLQLIERGKKKSLVKSCCCCFDMTVTSYATLLRVISALMLSLAFSLFTSIQTQ